MYTLVRLKFWKTQSHLFGDKLALEMNRLDLTHKRYPKAGRKYKAGGENSEMQSSSDMGWGPCERSWRTNAQLSRIHALRTHSLFSLQTLTMLHII